MKQKFFFGSLAVLAFMASCSSSNDDLNGGATTQENNVPLTFSSYLGKTATSRAGATGTITTDGANSTTSLQTQGFGLFATYTDNAEYTATTGPNFMYNTKVSGENWTYSPLRYWPNETSTTDADGKGATSEGVDRLSFFAYAPYVSLSDNKEGTVTGDATVGITKLTGNAATTDPKVTYVVSSDPSKSVDLLWGVVPAGVSKWSNVTGTDIDIAEGKPYLNLIKPNTSQKVAFNFKHALAKLGLKVVGAFDALTGGTKDNATKITVASVTIEGTGFKKTAVLNLNNNTANTPLWEAVDGASDITLTVDGTNINSNIKDSGTDEAQTVTGVTETATDLLNADATSAQKAFMIIPSSADTKSLKVTIDYYVNTTDASLSKGYSRVKNKITKTITGFAPEAGKNYTLLLSLGMTSVKVTASVADWTDATTDENKQVDLPINVE
jgi:ABC-type Fe3+-hydroxamate transport system substrate-binding protein